MDKTGFLKPSDIYVAIASNQNKIETKYINYIKGDTQQSI